MSKTQRNDPCPCGSGLKFKNCHGGNKKSNTQLPIIVHQLIIRKYFSEGHIDLDRELDSYKLNIFEIVLKEMNVNNLEQTEFLKLYLDQCENLMKVVASEHSIYELLYWSRRLAPKNIFKTSELSVELYRDIQALCIYKYGNTKQNVAFDSTGSIHPEYMVELQKMDSLALFSKLQNENLDLEIVLALNCVIRLEILSYIFLRVTQDIRILNKGGTLNLLKSHSGYTVETNKTLDYLLDLYDSRLDNANLFSFTGAYVDTEGFGKEDVFFYAHVRTNVDNKIRIPLFNGRTESYKEIFGRHDKIEIDPNYIFSPVNIKTIYEFLVLFEVEFEKYHGFSVKDFILLLWFLGIKFFQSITTHYYAQINILNRAYTVSKFHVKEYSEAFDAQCEEAYKLIFNEELNHKIDFVKMLNCFLLTSENRSDIDLWTRGPKRFLYQISEEFMVSDYYCLGNVVSFIVKTLTAVDGEVGNVRAISFENAIKSELERLVPEALWKCSEVIYAAKNGKREIDASFFVDDILIILEAKAVNVSMGFEKGDVKAVNYRINKMKSALKEVDDKAIFIQKNYEYLKAILPPKIKFILPIVISSYPEYIWEKVEDLFIAEELALPRIITINDLKSLVTVPNEILKSKKYCVAI